jgi:hypothetical protein
MAREDDERREIRREKQRRRLGARLPRCHRCSEQEPPALIERKGEVWCYECLAEKVGRSRFEAHHLAGRYNDPFTVAIPGNWHRVVSDDQYNWDPRTLRNPDGSGLRATAATLRGGTDLVRLVIDRMSVVVPYLELLDVVLTDRHGERWWEALGLDQPPWLR